jgi:glycosyltransferase involved in cell wall biosynthesis
MYGRKNLSVAGCAVALSSAVPLEMRDSARDRLGLGQELVVAFNGSFFADWGDPNEYVDLFKIIKRFGFNPIFLVLTQTPAEKVEEFLGSRSISPAEYRVLSLAHETIPSILVAADLGLLLRKESIVNRLASPMKFPEYLMSGVPVIATDNIGDISNQIRSFRLGLIYDKTDPAIPGELHSWLEYVQSEDGTAIKRRCREFAEAFLSYNVQKEVYVGVYSLVASSHE